MDECIESTSLLSLLTQRTRCHYAVNQAVDDYVAANALRLAYVAADTRPEEEADRRHEDERQAVEGPRAAGRSGHLTSGHAWAEEREDAHFPVVETAPQRVRELAHRPSTHTKQLKTYTHIA